MEYVDGRSLADILRAARPPVTDAGRRGGHRGGRRARLRPPQRRRPPRHQAGQHPRSPPTAGEGGRLRHRPCLQHRHPGGPHPGRRGDGHGHLLLTRAGPGLGPRSAQRPLLARHRDVRDGRPAARRSAATTPSPSPTSRCTRPPLPLHQVQPEVPAGYEAIVGQLLAKNPAQRYAAADDLRADLQRFREGHTVQASRQLRSARPWPSARRPRRPRPWVLWPAPPRCRADDGPGVARTARLRLRLRRAAPQPRLAGGRDRAAARRPRRRRLAALPRPVGRRGEAGHAAIGDRPAHRRGREDPHRRGLQGDRGPCAQRRVRAWPRLRAGPATRSGRRRFGRQAHLQPGGHPGRPAQPRRQDAAPRPSRSSPS